MDHEKQTKSEEPEFPLKGFSVKLNEDFYSPHFRCQGCGKLMMVEGFFPDLDPDDARLHLLLEFICSDKSNCGRMERWDLPTAFEYTHLAAPGAFKVDDSDHSD